MSDPSEYLGRRLLLRLGIDLRPGEVALALNMFATFFLITTFQITTKTLRQSTFVDALGAARLPIVYLLVALLSYPFLRLYNRWAERHSTRRLIQLSSLAVGLGLIAFWSLFERGWSWVPLVFYVMTSITYALLISQFWMLANHGLDARQARRLFGFIGAGGLLGGIVGGQTARLTAGLATTAGPLAAAALALLAVALLLERPEIAAIEGTAQPGGALGKLDKAHGGLAILRRSPQLRWIAVLMVLSVIVAQIVDLQFNWAVESSTDGLEERTAFFGNFFSVMGISAFVFQLAFTGHIHRLLGVAFAIRILPVTLALGTAALLLASGLMPSLLIAAALVLKIGDNGVRYSIDQATRELLFLPVPSELRMRAKAFIDVFLQRGAKGVAALLLLPVTFGLITAPQTGWFSLALVAVWLVATVHAYRTYVSTFRQGLQHRTVEAGFSADLEDPVTLELVKQSLASGDRRQVLHGLEILSEQRKGELIPPFLLYHDDPVIRRKVLSVLAIGGRLDAAPLIEQRLSDEDPDVRAEAMRVLADLHGQDVCELMVPRLEDADAGVRAAAVACLSNHGGGDTEPLAERVLGELIAEDDPAVRVEAARAIGAIAEPRHRQELISLLYDPSPEVVNAAAAAVRQRVARDGPSPLYLPSLVALLSDRRVKHRARDALIAYGDEVVPALRHFLTDPQERLWVRRSLPRVLELLESPRAMRALVGSLESIPDLFTRRKLIRALRDGRERLTMDAETETRIKGAIRVEAESYLRTLARLYGLNALADADCSGAVVRWSEEAAPDLLERLLAERAADHIDNLFSLLAVLYEERDIEAAREGLVCGDRARRAHALEYLDNLLAGDCRRAVLAAIDDQPVRDKLRNAWRLFELPVASRRSTLRELLDRDEADEESEGLVIAALYAVHTDRAGDLYARVRRLAAATADPLVRQTADWVLLRGAHHRA